MATAELRDDGYIVVVMNMREADELTDAVEGYSVVDPEAEAEVVPSVYYALTELASTEVGGPAVLAGLKVAGYFVPEPRESAERQSAAEHIDAAYERATTDPGSELD